MERYYTSFKETPLCRFYGCSVICDGDRKTNTCRQEMRSGDHVAIHEAVSVKENDIKKNKIYREFLELVGGGITLNK